MNAFAQAWTARAPARPFADVAREHLDDVYRYLMFLTADPHLAEDLSGETFEKALRSWKRFDPRRGLERTGGPSGAAHKAVDILRGAGSVAVFLAIVLSPVLLLVVLAWLALRARTRRVEARLLADPRPGTSTAERSS